MQEAIVPYTAVSEGLFLGSSLRRPTLVTSWDHSIPTRRRAPGQNASKTDHALLPAGFVCYQHSEDDACFGLSLVPVQTELHSVHAFASKVAFVFPCTFMFNSTCHDVDPSMGPKT